MKRTSKSGHYTPPPEVGAAAAATVGRLFAATAALRPDRTALVEGERSLTYAELDSRVNRLANALIRRGAGRGDRVALMARNCIGYIEVELACARIGAIAVGMNWRFTADETAHGLNLTGPSLVVASAEYEPVLKSAGFPADLILGGDLEAAMAAAPDTDPGRHVEPEDGMVIIFTSGTTGHPKGATISHRATIARTLIYGAELAVPADDTFVAWTPLFHMGANDFALATLLRGGRVVVMDGYRPQELIRAIETWPVHYLAAVPGMVEDFVTHLKASSRDFRPVGMVGAMPDLVPRQQLKEITELLGAPYLNTFGSTETGIPPATANFVPIGAAPETLSKAQNAFCEIRLVDADGNDVPGGETGELAIRGPSLFSGYWGNDEANREAFRNGWFHMGDAFRRNPDGTLDFVDRVKYMIKSGGENIYPAEIEQHILADPRISDAAVVRKQDDRWGEVPVVFAARTDETLTGDQVIAMCRGRIANYKLPKEVHFVAMEDLPRSTSGKIQRHVLEERLG